MLLPAIQVSAVAAFLLLALAQPRREQGLLHADTAINLVTGAGLAAFKLLVLTWLVTGIDAGGALDLGSVPPLLRLLVAFALLDLARWALHLAHHKVPFLWAFHRVHHSSERLDATSGLRMHLVDFVQLALLPVLLFGVVLDLGEAARWIVPAALVPGLVFDAFQHANLRMDVRARFWRAWDRVLTNPHFHAWHHTADGALCDGNYGNVLTVWDRLFGTCVSRDALPEAFGLSPGQALHNDPIALQLLRRRAG